MLWNSLATVLAEVGRAEESLIFYQEAIRLDPGFSRPYHNLGYAFRIWAGLKKRLRPMIRRLNAPSTKPNNAKAGIRAASA